MTFFAPAYKKYNENVGNSYNTYLIQDLLRGEPGYEGVVCNESQLKSITMLKNKDSVLPIKRGIKVYVPQGRFGPIRTS